MSNKPAAEVSNKSAIINVSDAIFIKSAAIHLTLC